MVSLDEGLNPITDPIVRKFKATVHDLCVFRLFRLCFLAVDLSGYRAGWGCSPGMETFPFPLTVKNRL